MERIKIRNREEESSVPLVRFLASRTSHNSSVLFDYFSQDLQSADTSEQFKHRLKNWLFKCAYG